MDNEVVRELLSTSWIDLSDAFALRRVSKGWNQALDKDDVFVWESIIDRTHGRDVANRIRRSLSPRKGYELACHIHLRNNNYSSDEPTIRLRTTKDLTCLIEFSRRDTKSGRKIQLASVYATWDELSWGIGNFDDQGALPAIPAPNLFKRFPKYGDLKEKEQDQIFQDKIYIRGCNIGRVTFFRHDTQQRLSEKFKIKYVKGIKEFKGQKWRRGWDRFPFSMKFVLSPCYWFQKEDTMLKLEMWSCSIQLQKVTHHGNYAKDDVIDEIRNGNELLDVFNRFAWK